MKTLIRHGLGSDRLMPISALDAYEDHFPLAYVAFFRKALDPAVLQRALRQILPDYPLLAGRIARDGRGEKVIALNDAGLGFEVRESLESLRDWREPDRNRIARFVDVVYPQDPRRWRRPLMNVRVTQLCGGGSVLGIGLGHVLTDGFGLSGFLRDWARAARGEPTTKPMWDREEQARELGTAGFDRSGVPVRSRSYLGLSEATPWELAKLYVHLLWKLPQWVGFTIPLRGERIERLKESVNAGSSERLSSNDILCAYLWKLINGALEPEGRRRTRFFGVADLRRHTPGVPERGVFGCMSGHLAIESTTEQTARRDLYELARVLRHESRAIAPERFAQQEAWLQQRRVDGRMSRVLAAEPYRGDVAVSNCRFIPFYDMDFGGGRPYFFNLPAEKFPRVVIWPAADGDGCVLDLNLTRRMARAILPALVQREPLTAASIDRIAA